VRRRADEREAATVDGCERAARGQQGGLVARLRGDGIRVEHGRHLERLQPVEVVAPVAALQLFTRSRAAFHHLERVQQREQPLA
jgi:hypothetical protein